MSRNCEESAAQVYLYLDKEMTLYRRVRIWWHLKKCPPCADGFHFEAWFKNRVGKGCHEDPPPELYDRLRTFLQQHGASEQDG